MRKIFLTTFLISALAISTLGYQTVSANEITEPNVAVQEIPTENTETINPLSTASYFYWRQTGSSYSHSNYVSDWITHSRPYIQDTGDTHILNFNYSQKGSISYGISVAGKLFGGGLSYTPGTNASVSGSRGSRGLEGKTTYLAQYKKKELVYNITQKQYHYEFGTDTYVQTKVGKQAFPTDPDARWVKQ